MFDRRSVPAMLALTVGTCFVLGCDGNNSVLSDAFDAPVGACWTRSGTYGTVTHFDRAEGDCPAWVVTMFGDYMGITIPPVTLCGPIERTASFSSGCGNTGCGGSVVVEAIAHATGIYDGTTTIESTCDDSSCVQPGAQCITTIPVSFEFLEEPRDASSDAQPADAGPP